MCSAIAGPIRLKCSENGRYECAIGMHQNVKMSQANGVEGVDKKINEQLAVCGYV